MRVYTQEDPRKDLQHENWQKRGTAVALGSFDAVHIGHQMLIRQVVEYAKKMDLTSVVYLFRNQPRSVLGGVPVPAVNTFEGRIQILKELGVDVVIAQWFTPEFAAISAETFVLDYLKNWLHAKYVAAGFNYHFGCRGEGDIHTLCALCRREGIRIDEIPCVALEGYPVSSTRVRSLIQDGKMEEAAACLGRPFSLSGTVINGNQLGRTMGFPTANIAMPEGVVLPHYGVYVSRTMVDGKWYRSITNVGDKPTVKKNSLCIESHLLAFSGDIYGKPIEIQFYYYIRGITKFENLDQLKRQLESDKKTAQMFFGKETQRFSLHVGPNSERK